MNTENTPTLHNFSTALIRQIRRTFFIVIAVTPLFLFLFAWLLRMRSAMPDFPSKAVGEYFLYLVAAPIFLIWMVSTLLNRDEAARA